MPPEFNLCDVTESIVEDIKVIRKISDDKKVDCLESLIENWNLVKWIKSFQSMELLILIFVQVAILSLSTQV